MAWFLLWLACGWTEGEAPAPATDPLQLARVALHDAEHQLLRAETESRLEAGDLVGAATGLLAAERVGGLPELVDRAVEEAERRDPSLAAELHQALFDAIRDDPPRAAKHAERAAELRSVAAVRSRYGAEGLEPSLARVKGVHRGMLGPALRLATTRHVEPPTPAQMVGAAQARLQALSETGAFGTVDPAQVAGAAAPEVVELEGAVAAGEAAVERAMAAGLPESVAVAEWVEGALTAFGPWTTIAWPAELGDWEVHHSGVEVGIGVELEEVSGAVLVSKPEPDGPAWRAGVHRADQVVAVVDGASRTVASEGAAAVGRALRGAIGTQVTVELLREGAPLTLQIERGAVTRVTVHGWSRGEDNAQQVPIQGHPGLGYLRIEAFRSGTDEAVEALLQGAGPLQGLIVDLRGNGGGDVQAAANTADWFLADGVVAQLVGPGAPPPPAEGEVAWNAMLEGDPWEALPLVVLIDRNTASAAELLAGALGRRDGVVLLGERTFGKGWSQGLEQHPEHGFALQVTNAAWTLPEGQPIQRTAGASPGGVPPDVELVASAAEDWQNGVRREALEFPRTHGDGSPMHPPDRGSRPGLPTLPVDPAVDRALKILQRTR